MMDSGYLTDKENEFRLRSAECRNHAAKAPTEELREHYLWLAEMWHELAQTRAALLKLKGEAHEARYRLGGPDHNARET